MVNSFNKACSALVMLSLLVLSFPIMPAHAAMVATEQLVQEQGTAPERARVAAFLERADAQAELQRLGVDADQAKVRIASLSDEELRVLAGRIDQLPAGGDAAGALIGALLVVFLVLLVTDLVGLTDVYPFVHQR